MNRSSQGPLWIGLLVAIVLGASWQFVDLPDAKERMTRLPLYGPEYKGYDIPLKPYEKEFLKDVNVLKRQYLIADQKFFITILDGSRNRHVVHDPYYCFKGSGWRIISEEPQKTPKGEAQHLLIGKEHGEREALFWFSDGKTQYTSPIKYWLHATWRRVTLGLSGPEPILIVVQPINEEKIDWAKFSKSFHPLFEL